MANTLSNKITKAQAEAAADATYAKYTELATVYGNITEQANGGGYSYVYTVPDGDAERTDFLATELLADGYGVAIASNVLTITWGTPPES